MKNSVFHRANLFNEPGQCPPRQFPVVRFPVTCRVADELGKSFEPQSDVVFSQAAELPFVSSQQFPRFVPRQAGMNDSFLDQSLDCGGAEQGEDIQDAPTAGQMAKRLAVQIPEILSDANQHFCF